MWSFNGGLILLPNKMHDEKTKKKAQHIKDSVRAHNFMCVLCVYVSVCYVCVCKIWIIKDRWAPFTPPPDQQSVSSLILDVLI